MPTKNKSSVRKIQIDWQTVIQFGGYAVFAGLDQVIEYVENLHFDDEDLSYFRSLNLFQEEFLEYLKDFRFRGDIIL